MEPRFVERPETHVIGLTTRFIGGSSPSRNSQKVIPALWEEVFAKAGTITHRKGSHGFGVYWPPADRQTHPDEMEYLAGTEVEPDAEPPAGFRKITLPGGRYAVFTHRGKLSELPRTLQEIYGNWLPTATHMLRDAPHFESYDQRFRGDEPDSEWDICIPVR